MILIILIIVIRSQRPASHYKKKHWFSDRDAKEEESSSDTTGSRWVQNFASSRSDEQLIRIDDIPKSWISLQMIQLWLSQWDRRTSEKSKGGCVTVNTNIANCIFLKIDSCLICSVYLIPEPNYPVNPTSLANAELSDTSRCGQNSIWSLYKGKKPMIFHIFRILRQLNKFWFCSEDFEGLREMFEGDTGTWIGNGYEIDFKTSQCEK